MSAYAVYMGLSLPVGKGRKRIGAAALHVAGAGVGGAAVGACTGSLGQYLGLPSLRGWVIGIAALYAVTTMIARRRRPRAYGLRRQVPRNLGRRVGDLMAYWLWGLMLGAGLTTLIPYSSYLVLLGAESASGVALATLSGLLFGIGRESTTLLALSGRRQLAAISDLLQTMSGPARWLNSVLVAIGGGSLIALSVLGG